MKNVIDKYGLHSKRTIVTVGRLEERKGHERVIQALIEIRKLVPGIKYLIVGKGPQEELLMDLVSRWLLKDIVLFTGEVSDQEKVGILHACDLFIMPNRDIPLDKGLDTEGFGIVFLEANACRKPVIGGEMGGVKEVIVDGKTGLLVNPEDRVEIKEAILKILLNHRLARSMGENGRKRVLQKFQWSNIADAYVAEFKRI
jgi:phosphatidylinositol alpha-1,6-mannosyltransferase